MASLAGFEPTLTGRKPVVLGHYTTGTLKSNSQNPGRDYRSASRQPLCAMARQASDMISAIAPQQSNPRSNRAKAGCARPLHYRDIEMIPPVGVAPT